jgi:hypothetical protein
MAENRYVADLSKTDWIEKTGKVLSFSGSIFQELLYGIKAKTVPWAECLVAGTLIGICIIRHWDYRILESRHLTILYPTKPFFYWSYCFFSITLPWWIWAIFQVHLRRKLIEALSDTLLGAGLKNLLGRLPAFVFDRAIDEQTRKLRLTRNNLAMTQFKAAQSSLEGDLKIFIDEFRENRESGTVDIIYSHLRMPPLTYIDDIKNLPPYTFVIGKTRSRQLTSNFTSTPHLLVAGQTGGGKSTFLRQLITSLRLNNDSCQFTLIDLKDGLEFQLFDGVKNVEVASNIQQAVSGLQHLETAMANRTALLKENQCKDLEAYFKIPKEKRTNRQNLAVNMNRHIIVVDEIAELFLAGPHAKSNEIQAARNIASKIARQGRSSGIHLIAATQRPDVRALDPQVKACLVGVVCMQMANNASSMTVLDNVRGADLPPIPGRAIWKCGSDMIEVQTPFLSDSDASELLKDKRDLDKVTELTQGKSAPAPTNKKDSLTVQQEMIRREI